MRARPVREQSALRYGPADDPRLCGTMEGEEALMTAILEVDAELSRDRVSHLASLVRSLTYGEMIELAERLWEAKGEEEITEGTLPEVLWRWATE
jgi:hypothetical protein